MSLPAPLVTSRLRCRIAEPGDAAALLRYRVENREHLAPWEPRRGPDYYRLVHCERTIDEGRQSAAADRAYPFLVFAHDGGGEVLASFTLSGVIRGPFQASLLGYGAAATSEGRGIMREALQAALAWAFAGLGLHRVMANHLPRNVRSERLLAALGFEREGLARRYLQIDGVWEDHVLNARIASD